MTEPANNQQELHNSALLPIFELLDFDIFKPFSWVQCIFQGPLQFLCLITQCGLIVSSVYVLAAH